MEDAAHRTIYFMRRLIGVASGDFGWWLVITAMVVVASILDSVAG